MDNFRPSTPTPVLTPVRTRFAPSPTGYLHLGGARTALYAWAFARHYGGQFILRIEDTDLARSTPEAVQTIIDGMRWLGLDHDEGPFYQTQRFDRYRSAIAELLATGHAYYCYSTPEEVEQMREAAKAQGRKPKYDGTWRPEVGKTLPPVPADRQPVVRFKNPSAGQVQWVDMVKGPISIDNAELDDLIIARQDGTPTYNFCVVIDDWDMQISHVIRGDDHINNTPRQINILHALGAPIPTYGHLPMILGPDGQKLSKRHGAVSVTQYDEQGYSADAMINYLARLGWSHGDDELFTRKQLVQWFDGTHLSKSASQWDPKKLNWVNAHYMKQADPQALAKAVAPRIVALGGSVSADDPRLPAVLALFQDRADTLQALAHSSLLFFGPYVPASNELRAQVSRDNTPALLQAFAQRAQALEHWTADNIQTVIKTVLADFGEKMPALGIPLRVWCTGQPQTPAVHHVLALLGRKVVLARLSA